TPEEVNAELFQEDLVENVELTTHIGEDEFEAPISLSQGNEVEEVDPCEIKGSIGRRTDIECESSDEEEEYTSDECEDDDEDEVELDISSSSEEEIYGAWSTTGLQFWEEPPWEGFVPGISFWFFVCLGEFTPPHPIVPVAGPSSVHPPVAPGSGSGQSTPSPTTVVGPVPEDAVSLQEGGSSFYDSTLREVWINGDKIELAQASQFITRTI
ncbi:hypothetical protein Taro_031683, partial [Colocasia esculenta]|nr:hypothetical protein [Colocasia esculenta]